MHRLRGIDATKMEAAQFFFGMISSFFVHGDQDAFDAINQKISPSPPKHDAAVFDLVHTDLTALLGCKELAEWLNQNHDYIESQALRTLRILRPLSAVYAFEIMQCLCVFWCHAA